MTCLKYYLLCLLTKTVFYLHFIIHDTTAKKKSLVIFFFSAILRIQLLQFMRHAMKALWCNGFVAGPVSLQLTGHPFAKPHVPCVVANRKQVCAQLCFVHERASTSSCWSVKFLCKHEICPDLTWRVNCNTFYQFSEFFQKKCWQINIHMIVYRSRLQKLTNIKGYSSMVEQRSPKP